MMDKEKIKLMLRKYPKMFSRIIVSGIDIDKLMDKTALIVGAGGLGVLVSEMLARTGIGKIIIVDRDVVGEENFNRLGFNREDIGKPKAFALKEKIERLRNSKNIPSDFHIKVEAYREDIIAWPKLEELIKESDIVFTCLDNKDARLEVNYFSMMYKKPLVDGATGISGLSGTIITVIPCKSPCYECHYGPDTSIKVDTIERAGACDASLANVMAIVASLQVDQGIKILLNFGEVYDLLKIHLDKGVEITKLKGLKPRPDCMVHKEFCGASK